jgi:hypothetical protein
VGDYWVIRQLNAHAWAEVWLQGEGWIRIDPTAAVAPERVFDTVYDLDGGFGDALRPVLDFGDSIREAWNNFVVGYDAIRQIRLLQSLGWRNTDPLAVGQAFVIAAGIALGLTLLVLRWPPKGERDPLLRAWRGFLRRWAKRGMEKRPNETAEAFLERLRSGASTPSAADDAEALVRRFIAQRYAPSNTDADHERAALIEALKRHRPR